MIQFKIKGCAVDIHAAPPQKQKESKGLHIVKCEYSQTAVLMDGHTPLLCVTKEDLKSLYEMLQYDVADTTVSAMVQVVSDWLDSH